MLVVACCTLHVACCMLFDVVVWLLLVVCRLSCVVCCWLLLCVTVFLKGKRSMLLLFVFGFVLSYVSVVV